MSGNFAGCYASKKAKVDLGNGIDLRFFYWAFVVQLNGNVQLMESLTRFV
ncbi:MAG: hypothetical protein RLZZ519_598 [Bacteroidota bacterium]|jgi:hypothetical protein